VSYRLTANATRAEEKIDAVPALPPAEQTADALPVAAVMV
jgi:hypothetical protein